MKLRCEMVIKGVGSGEREVEPRRLSEQVVVKPGPAPAGRNVLRTTDGVVAAYIMQWNDQNVVVHNGIEGKPYDYMQSISGTKDRKHIAYEVQEKEKQFIVCDQLAGPDYEEVSNPGSSEDGRHLCYVAKRGGPWCMVIDGIEGPPHAGAELFGPTKGDWKKRAMRYIVTDGGRQSLVEVTWPEDVDWSNGLKPIEGEKK